MGAFFAIIIGAAALLLGLRMEPENGPLVVVGGFILIVGIFMLPPFVKRK